MLDYLRCAPNGPHIGVGRRINHIPLRTISILIMGAGPGSYDIRQSVWHVNCCSPLQGGGGGWGIFNAILGWTNSATYGSVLSYNFYWLAVILWFMLMRYKENHGHFPLLGGSSKRSSSWVGPDPENIECTGVMAGPGENKAMDPFASQVHTARC